MIVSILLVPAIAYLFYDSWLGLVPGAVTGGLLPGMEEGKEEK